MIRILFVTADPSDLGRLRLGKEFRVVEESLRLSKYRDKFELKHSPATRHRDFIQAIVDFDPHIVHFSGHSSDGGISLENDAGESSLASARDLDRIFEQLGGKICCVVLNACHSRTPADAILPHVRHVIGIRNPIGDDVAIGFSGGFYQGLANGFDVPGAFQLGRAATGDESSQRNFVHDENPDGVSCDLRFFAHLPVMIGMRCEPNQFQELTRDALQTMDQYDFRSDLYRGRGLSPDDYSFYYASKWLPADSDEWKQAIYEGCDIVARLGSKVEDAKIYHFFMRVPICFAMGLGAALGTKQEVIVYHHQKNESPLAYSPVLDLSVRPSQESGPHAVRLRIEGEFRYISTEGTERPARKMYAALDFVPTAPAGVSDLARKNRASFVQISSTHNGHIPLDADWLRIAQEINTVLLGLLAEGCHELHLFPAVPVPLAFAIGMGLDTRCPVVVHQWYSPEVGHNEVFRLNELVPTGK